MELPQGFVPNNEEKIPTLADIEKSYILQVFEKQKGHVTETAKLLGIGHATLYRKLKQYNKESR